MKTFHPSYCILTKKHILYHGGGYPKLSTKTRCCKICRSCYIFDVFINIIIKIVIEKKLIPFLLHVSGIFRTKLSIKFYFSECFKNKTLSGFFVGYKEFVEQNMVTFWCFKVEKNNKPGLDSNTQDQN